MVMEAVIRAKEKIKIASEYDLTCTQMFFLHVQLHLNTHIFYTF